MKALDVWGRDGRGRLVQSSMTKLRELFEDLPRLGPFSDEDVIRELDDGLVLRHGTSGRP